MSNDMLTNVGKFNDSHAQRHDVIPEFFSRGSNNTRRLNKCSQAAGFPRKARGNDERISERTVLFLETSPSRIHCMVYCNNARLLNFVIAHDQ